MRNPKSDDSIFIGVLLVSSILESPSDAKRFLFLSNWILDSGSTYHLCGDKKMFPTFAACDGELVWMVNNTTSRVVSKG